MKKYILGIVAVLGAIVFSAFTEEASNKSTVTPVIFTYTGDPGDEDDLDNYQVKQSGQRECFAPSGPLCEILAEPVNPSDPQAEWIPNLSTAVEYYRPN